MRRARYHSFFLFLVWTAVASCPLASPVKGPAPAKVSESAKKPNSTSLKAHGNAEAQKPKPAPAASPAPSSRGPSAAGKRTSLTDYLEARLGPGKFHRRTEWAGHSTEYAPNPKPPYVWESIGTVRYLTIHHAGGVPFQSPAEMIRNIYFGQTSRRGPVGGAADIAYHFFVDRNGEVWEARDATKMGSHVGSTPHGLNNAGNLGICGLGVFTDRTPPKAMCDGIVRLSEALCRYYGRGLTVRGHRDWTGINNFGRNRKEDCPGKLEAAVEAARSRIALMQLEKSVEIATKK